MGHYSILERVTAKAIELRVRLEDYFQDFDNLRKGFCSKGQMNTVFGILGLSKYFTFEELEGLKAMYLEMEGEQCKREMFNYARFCGDVSSATTYKELHKDPLARTAIAPSSCTMPARRSKRDLTEKENAQILEIEADIRSRVLKRRILFVNQFKDFDRTNQGHVTVAQFSRVMASLGMRQDDEPTELLAKKYCDLGGRYTNAASRLHFNYREFCAVCDPVPDELKLAELQSKQPYVLPTATTYFTMNGQVDYPN